MGTAFVIDSEGRLLASVTDGDIRRALLAGVGLDADAEEAYNTDCQTLDESKLKGPSDLSATRSGDYPVPVIDPRGRVVGIQTVGSFASERRKANRVVIMAGGQGMRLRPLTVHTPKPMLSVGGKPILERIIESLASDGFFHLSIAVNYLAEQIEDHFQDGSSFGVEIEYLREKERLGTAGALSLLGSHASSPVVVMNGDLLLEAKVSRLLNFHREQQALITVGAKLVETTIPYGVLSTVGLVVDQIVEKPTYTDLVNAGIYVLDPGIVDSLKPEPIDMTDLINRNSDRGRVFAFPIHESWADLGSHSDLKKAEYLLGGK